MRRIEDIADAVLDLYERWPGDAEIDNQDRLVLAHVAELLALLVDREVRPRTVKVPATGLALRRVELSRQLDRLLSELRST